MVLMTKLEESGIKVVRDHLETYGTEEVRKMIAKARDFHYSVWLSAANDEASIRLWELH